MLKVSYSIVHLFHDALWTDVCSDGKLMAYVYKKEKANIIHGC